MSVNLHQARCALAIMLLLAVPGCALTNKGDPLNLRYFAPFTPNASGVAPTGSALEPVVVRINRVEAAAHLNESIAYRKSESELAYYDDLRWTEIPNVYLMRAVGEALFGDGKMRRGITDGDYSIDIELEGFEELKFELPRVRVAARVWVGNERQVLSERRVVVEEAIAGEKGDEHPVQLANAFARALNQAARLIRQQVEHTTTPPPVGEANNEPLAEPAPIIEPAQ